MSRIMLPPQSCTQHISGTDRPVTYSLAESYKRGNLLPPFWHTYCQEVCQRPEMKIGIPVWNGSVSSVFDFAHQLAVVDVGGQQAVRRSQIGLREQPMQRRVEELLSLGIDVLICGAISQSLASMLAASNIKVIPFVSGSLDSVLDAYFTGRLSEPQFLQPGCRPGARNRFRHRYTGRHRRSGGRRQCK